jgi:gluconolactonase
MPEILATGVGFVEGPVWYDDALYFTSILEGVIKRLDDDGVHEVFRPGAGPNGLTVDKDGVFYVANNGGLFEHVAPSCIQRINKDGSIDVVVDQVDGQPFRDCNDLCFGPDGYLYFTDSGENHVVSQELYDQGKPPEKPGFVCKLDVKTGAVEVVNDTCYFPNGLGFNPADTHLYVSDTTRHEIIVFPWTEQGVGAEIQAIGLSGEGGPDGFAFDTAGRIYTASTLSGDLQIFDPDGKPERTIRWEDKSLTLNCCFGGPERTRLYVTDIGSLQPADPEWKQENERIVAIDFDAAGLPLHDGSVSS